MQQRIDQPLIVSSALLLLPFMGHDLPLSLAELREELGARKSDLLRALAIAERRGDLVRRGPCLWGRGERLTHAAARVMPPVAACDPLQMG